MLLKKINLKGGKLIFTGISPRLSMLFRLYGMDPSPFSGDVGNSGFSSGKQDVSAAIRIQRPARRQRKRAIAETGARSQAAFSPFLNGWTRFQRL